YGVLYPLQSFRRELEDQPEFPLLIDANSPGSLEELKKMAAGLSKTILPAGNEMRLKYHLAAVLAGNFSNHLYSLTESWCRREEIDFGLLQPLIRETAGRLLNELPENLQTGPAIRNDTETLEKHRELLQKYPELSQLYEVMTRSIQQFHHIQ
ncbi:MAG TPA: DUF2520 domain-containing protein, partial [Puia sp.]